MSKWEPKEKRIDGIVNAAIEVFLEKGYEGTSMETIAQKAQISKGGLYHHFRSKEEILYFAIDRLCGRSNLSPGVPSALPMRTFVSPLLTNLSKPVHLVKMG